MACDVRAGRAYFTRLCRRAGAESSGNERLSAICLSPSLFRSVLKVCATFSCNCFKHREKQSRTVLTLFSRVRYQSAPIVPAGLAATWLPHIPSSIRRDKHFQVF